MMWALSVVLAHPSADDDFAQFLGQARPTHGLKSVSTAHLGEPALVGRGLCHVHQTVDIMPAFFSDAQQLGFLGRRQDNPLCRNTSPQDGDLGFQKSELRIVPRHEKLVQENPKER